MRSNKAFRMSDGSICTTGLDDAVKWFSDNGIPLYGIQTNPTQKHWTESPKAYGQIIIDDANIFAPLIYPEKGRPFIDWERIRVELIRLGYIDEGL